MMLNNNESWNLLDIDGWEKLLARRLAAHQMIQPEEAVLVNDTSRLQPFAVPTNERSYWNLDPWQRQALARRFQRQIRPATPKADIADLLDTRGHDCHCGGSCGPCGGGLGFAYGPPTESESESEPGDWGWLNDWLNWGWDDFSFINETPPGGDGGGSGLLPDDCGRPADHPSYGCPCGTLWGGFDVGCINPCEPGWQVEWKGYGDGLTVTRYEEYCVPTATQGPLDCPKGTVKNGSYCVDPGTNQTRTPVSRQTPTGQSPQPRSTPRGPTPTTSQNPSAAALAQAQAICQRTGRTYDQRQRKCIGGAAVNQNAFGVLQENVGGVPVWGWALAAIAGIVLVSR